MGLRIIIEDYEGDTTIVPLEASGAPITVGRQEGNTIQLGEQNVSRAHARFIFDAERWVVEDLNSYNGIRVNGVLVDEGVSLEEGDVIQVGDYRLLFCSDKNKSANDSDDIPIQAESEDHRSTLVMMGNSISPEQILNAIPAQNSVVQEGQPTERVKKEVDTQRNTIKQVVEQVEENPVEPKPEQKVSTLTAVKAIMVVVALSGLAALVFFVSDPNSEEPASNSETVASVDQGTANANPVRPRSGEARQFDPSHPPLKKEQRLRGAAHRAQELGSVPSSSGSRPGSEETLSGDGKVSDHQPGEEQIDEDTMVWPIGTVLDEPEAAANSKGHRSSQRKASPPAKAEQRKDPTAPRKSGSSTSSNQTSVESKKNQVRAREYLQKAREASIAGKTGLAYRLAKRSFKASQSTDALQLMGVSACKMGQKKQAKEALNQLRGAKNKNLLRAFCSSNGIDLG